VRLSAQGNDGTTRTVIDAGIEGFGKYIVCHGSETDFIRALPESFRRIRIPDLLLVGAGRVLRSCSFLKVTFLGSPGNGSLGGHDE
jgi:hypothetical protein